jgi:class 3 adenylate cyclase
MNDPAPTEPIGTPADAVSLAEDRLHQGEPILAYNAAQSGLMRWPTHVRLRQLQALALARSGDVERANQLLAQLADEGQGDAETLGMLARTHKDLALAAADDKTRKQHLQAGFGLYLRAFEDARDRRDGDADAYYAGINAATMAVLNGEVERARAIADAVRGICERANPGDDGASSRYWREATLGEAALILGDAGAAERHYRRSAELAARRFGDVSSTRRQLRLLLSHLPPLDADLEDALRIPPVLAFTGHMIDGPDSRAPRFPAAIEEAVREAVGQHLAALQPTAVYGSAACGADILCLEAARALGCETHIVLPFPAAEFRRSSVDFAGGNWGERFEQALAAADSVTIASDHRASGSAATFEYANLIITGMGALRAEALDTGLRGLAVWDPRVKAIAGGAASVVAHWERQGLTVDHVDPHAFHGSRAAPPARASEPSEPGGVIRHEMRALLFADAVGYSQLSEDQIAGFITGFLEAVAGLNRRTGHPCEQVETSGDGLYMVFRTAFDAGRYALELSTLVREFDRKAWTLPPNFDLRIALHCGPVHCTRDPITGRNLYTGSHTNRAARIEPITPPGQVYASSAFAAVAAATGARGLSMRYVGRIPLAKGYGTLGVYCVRGTA